MLTAIVLQEKDVFKVARFSILVRSRFALRDGSFEIELAHTPSCMFERGINLSSIILEYFLFYFSCFLPATVCSGCLLGGHPQDLLKCLLNKRCPPEKFVQIAQYLLTINIHQFLMLKLPDC